MKYWLIDAEDIEREISFNNLKEVEDYILRTTDIREADKNFCEL